MSSNPPPTDHEWAQFYQMDLYSASTAGQGAPHRPLPPVLVQGSTNMASPSDGTYGTTTTATGFTTGGSGSSSSTCQLNPGAAAGRVSKPARKRRASRCAPVTLLNTDPTNFRAMVQQFTGVPNTPFSFADGAQTNIPNLSFGLSSTSTLNYPQSNPTIQPYQYHQQQQQQQQQQIFSLMNNNNSSSNTGDDHHALHYPMLFNNSTPNLLEVSSSAASPSGGAGDGRIPHGKHF